MSTLQTRTARVGAASLPLVHGAAGNPVGGTVRRTSCTTRACLYTLLVNWNAETSRNGETAHDHDDDSYERILCAPSRAAEEAVKESFVLQELPRSPSP